MALCLPRTEAAPEEYNPISFVCLRPEGAYESPATVSSVCRASRKKLDDMNDFHFHQLRHTYTSNLLSSGAQGCAGTSRTCRCKYHNEHLRSCYKGSQADFRKTARQSGRSRIKKLSLIFSREGKSKGKGQARGRENAENTSVFRGSGLRIR